LRTQRQSLFRWIIAACLLVLLLAGAALLFLVYLPDLLEHEATAVLTEKGFDVEAVPFEKVGFTTSRIGRGGLGFGDQRLKWESISVSYDPFRLVHGNVEEVLVSVPTLNLRIPAHPASLEGTASGGASSTVAAPSAPAGGASATVEPAPAQPGTGTPGPVGGTAPGDRVANLPVQVDRQPFSLDELIAKLPFSDAFITDGKLTVDADGRTLIRADWEGHVRNREDNLSITLTLGNPADEGHLTGRIDRSRDGFDLSASGTVSLEHLNGMVNWWLGNGITLSGMGPVLEARLAGPLYFLKGSARVLMESFDLAFSGGPLLKGISGEARFRVNGLPGTDGLQRLRIQSVTTGKVRLDDLQLDWALPTIRNFRMEKATARIGGGSVSMDTFTTDPFAPVVSTALRLDRIPAAQFLDWLGEDRFALDGTVSGKIVLKWKGGVLYIGESDLRMDSSTTINRLRFPDREFLTEQFGSMQGIPENLRKPFLATLLSDGIRISDLTLGLVPLPESREVALRLKLSGETKSEAMEVPIAGLVINNVISEEDLQDLLGLLGKVEFLSRP
jgi:hypothetical protein